MIALLAFAVPALSDIALLSPRDRQVFQRDTSVAADGTGKSGAADAAGSGEVPILVHAPGSVGHLTVALAAGKNVIARAELARRGTEGDLATFGATVRVPGGGWYRVAVLTDGIAGPVELAAVEHVGVGEVFVVAGQSNSTNSGEERIGALDDRVSAYDGEHWSLAQDPMPGVQDGTTGGSPWPTFGHLLASALDVPVAIASCGWGGTSIRSWQPDGFLENGGRKIVLLDALKQRCTSLGKFRAILWHQGESDAVGGMSSDEYVKLFGRMHDALRDATKVDAPWIVANASFVPGAEPAQLAGVRAAQRELWKRGLALQGPDTDDMQGALRHSKDHIHFSKAGLEAHGARWFAMVWAELFAQPALVKAK